MKTKTVIVIDLNTPENNMNKMLPVQQTMTPGIQTVYCDDYFLTVGWDNGHKGRFPFIFLQDDVLSVRHGNGQKLSETGTLSINTLPENIAMPDNKTVRI